MVLDMSERIDRILKYSFNDGDVWIYSVKDEDDNRNVLYKYYTLFIKDKIPVIIDLENPIATLQNIDIAPTEVKEGTKDYIIFMAYKDVAERKIMEKIKK